MKERPILFSAPMVRSILDGRKTQTRRVVKPQPQFEHPFWRWEGAGWPDGQNPMLVPCHSMYNGCPYGQPGDRLWVRETFATVGNVDPPWVLYRASGYESECERHGFDNPPPESSVKWKPSIHMPRRASRITLDLINVRVERLQDISDADSLAEGIKAISKDGKTLKYGIPDADGLPGNDNCGWTWADWQTTPKLAFQRLWTLINGAESWDANPWVWVLNINRLKGE